VASAGVLDVSKTGEEDWMYGTSTEEETTGVATDEETGVAEVEASGVSTGVAELTMGTAELETTTGGLAPYPLP
jgi:hypothetical protein